MLSALLTAFLSFLAVTAWLEGLPFIVPTVLAAILAYRLLPTHYGLLAAGLIIVMGSKWGKLERTRGTSRTRRW